MADTMILNGTKKNDVFKIELGNGNTYEIDGKSGGKDTISIISEKSPSTATYTQVKDGETLTKDLKITYTFMDDSETVTDTVIIKNYFTSTKADSTKSSIKYIEEGGLKLPLSEAIKYEGTYEVKKGKINGTMFSDDITGTDNNDKIYGKGGFDEIRGGAGNDYIYDASGIFAMIDGGDGNDIIKLGSHSFALVTGGAGDDKIYAGSAVKLNLMDMLAASEGLELGSLGVLGELFSPSLYVIDGGAGNDKLYGGSGTDMFVCTQSEGGFGLDMIYNARENDFLMLSGSEPLKYKKEGNHLVIESGEDSSVKLVNFFKGKKGKVLDSVSTSSATFSLLKTAIIDITGKGKINGTYLNDNIIGSDKKDTIKTGDGINIVDGNGGNDYIVSTKGKNTINIDNGDGNDTILVGTKSETNLNFDEDTDFVFVKKGNDLVIERQDSMETTTLKNYFTTDIKGYFKDKNVSIGDNDLLSILQTEQVSVIGKENKANKIDLRKYQDTFDFNIVGGNKSDKIYLGSGNHTVSSGAGNDVINIGNGENIIYTGAGNDKVKAGNGGNEFYYTSGKDVYESGIGNDEYHVQYSSETNLKIQDNGGEDSLYIDNLANTDLCLFFNVGEPVITNSSSTKLDGLYIFGVDENGNSMLNYENIINGFKGKEMSGVIEIDNVFENTYNNEEGSIDLKSVSDGCIEQLYGSNGEKFDLIDNYNQIRSEVENWLSSSSSDYGFFTCTADVLKYGSREAIESMLAVYNDASLQANI